MFYNWKKMYKIFGTPMDNGQNSIYFSNKKTKKTEAIT